MAFNDYMRQQMAGIRYPDVTSGPGPEPTPGPTPTMTHNQMEDEYRREGNIANHAIYKAGPLPAELTQFLLALFAAMQQGMATPQQPTALPPGMFGGGQFTPR